MNSNKKTERIIGVLFLIIFIIGVLVYQFLQDPILFADDFLTATSTNSNQIVISILLGFLSGILSIIIASKLLPIFKKYNYSLAFLYLALCIINFVIITVDNISILSMLELSQEYIKNGANNSDYFQSIGTVFYKTHWWTHYLSLLIFCFPLFVLYFTLYFSKLVPRFISVFGLIAVVLMFIEILSSIFEHSISMNMLLPMGIVELFFPIWLIIKGFNAKNGNQLAQ